MNASTTATDERASETRLRAVVLETEAVEAIAQLEVLAELMELRLEGGDDGAGAPAFSLRATIRKLRNALP